MQIIENQNLEFKQEYVPEIRKEVVAFANAEGGTVLIGVRKDGVILGVEDPDAVMQQVANSLKDAIAPDIMPFVSIKCITAENRHVVEINVSTGTNRPYYIREKGLKPGGVYVRKGSSSQPMTDEGIREMIVQNSGKSFETGRSMNQELTFASLSYEMQSRALAFSPAQMRTLKLEGEDGLYTNLAYLLSDQWGTTTKVALFQGTDKAVFRDRREFSGSILRQLEDVYQFIELNNKTKATFSGLNRVDTRDYPEEAVREAWLNCVVHRDYSFSGSTLINIYDDRIEFVSLGGLVPGLELKSVFLGVSQSRNPNLAALLYRMKLIESYGTGIGKIRRSYRDSRVQPEFETAQGVFRVTLPNRNEAEGAWKLPEPAPNVQCVRSGPAGQWDCGASDDGRQIGKQDSEPDGGRLREQKALIVEHAVQNGQITRKEAEELLGAGTTKAFRLLRELCEEGRLKAEGSGRLTRYMPVS